MTINEHKTHRELFKDARGLTVAGWLKNMTKEAVRRRLADLTQRRTHGESGHEGWEIGDIDQLKDEYDNRLYKNRV